MARPEASSLDPVPPLRALSERLQHDLSRYLAFQSRCVESHAPPELLREVLADDLLRTRRGPDGELDAAQIWAPLRDALAPLRARGGLGEAERALSDLQAAMAVIEGLVTALRAGTLPDEELPEAHRCAIRASDAARVASRALRNLPEAARG
ncbi:MAG: hypothetical protein EA397_11095 [Deltaproteobacteria bacterium]|nr:MAG: hypothetical protein EA397_11095 [Deltaproteobacteria bacterium]